MLKRPTLFALFLSLFVLQGLPQTKNIRTITPEMYSIDSLRKIFGKNKELLPGFEAQCLIALSAYPELQNAHIYFCRKDIRTTGKTSITAASLFRSKKKRCYIVYVSTNLHNQCISLEEAPFNAQTGVISHELAHIADFQRQSLAGLISWGARYLSSKSNRAKTERKTDSIAILHGMGWQLYDWIDYVTNHSGATEKYKKFKRKYYLHKEEIVQLIKAQTGNIR